MLHRLAKLNTASPCFMPAGKVAFDPTSNTTLLIADPSPIISFPNSPGCTDYTAVNPLKTRSGKS